MEGYKLSDREKEQQVIQKYREDARRWESSIRLCPVCPKCNMRRIWPHFETSSYPARPGWFGNVTCCSVCDAEHWEYYMTPGGGISKIPCTIRNRKIVENKKRFAW